MEIFPLELLLWKMMLTFHAILSIALSSIVYKLWLVSSFYLIFFPKVATLPSFLLSVEFSLVLEKEFTIFEPNCLAVHIA